MKKINTIILLSLVSILAACSDENQERSENKNNGDHIWKQQTDTLKTSKDVAKKLQESLNQQQKKLDESN